MIHTYGVAYTYKTMLYPVKHVRQTTERIKEFAYFNILQVEVCVSRKNANHMRHRRRKITFFRPNASRRYHEKKIQVAVERIFFFRLAKHVRCRHRKKKPFLRPTTPADNVKTFSCRRRRFSNAAYIFLRRAKRKSDRNERGRCRRKFFFYTPKDL